MASTTDILIPYKDLLEKFKKTAPGSYKHCDAVTELCNSICDELPEVNRDNLILAAKFHDIGKIFNPLYFTENQIDNKNIHDVLDPDISFQLISRHVSDSIAILIEYDEFPRECLKIISQHHGDSCIKSLVNKLKGKNKDKCKDEFRYNFNKPQSIEASILMICDVIEAATRSMFSSNKLDDIPKIVENLIQNLIEDYQIDNLTIGQLRIIKKVLIEMITNTYHSRIDYTGDEDIEKNDNNS